MVSRKAYQRLKQLILEVLPESRYTLGSISDILLHKYEDELIELDLVPEESEGCWIVEAYTVLEPKVRRQLENLVHEGKVEKNYGCHRAGPLNFLVRHSIYLPVGG